METTITPRYAVFCDDIRQEANGKYIFIGVYTQGLSVPGFPSNVALSFFMNGLFSGPDKSRFGLRVVLQPGELTVFQANASAERGLGPPDGTRFEFGTGGIYFQVQREGHVSLEFHGADEKWIEIERLPIVKGQPIPPTFFAQPPSQSPSSDPAS